MATTIEELDFKLIIDDAQFNKAVESAKNKAKELNVDLSKFLNLKQTLDDAGIDKKKYSELTKLVNAYTKLYTAQKKQEVADSKLALEHEKLNTQLQKTALLEEKIQKIRRGNNSSNDMLIEEIKHMHDKSNIQKEMSRYYRELEISSKKAHNAEIKNLANTYNHYKNLRKELTFQNSAFQQLKSIALAYFSVDMVRRFVSELVNVSAEFEKQKVALGSIINDTIKADTLFSKLQGLAVKSPFNFSELTNYTKQLSAFSIPVNELYDTTKMLADVSAGLGVDLGRIVLAYGQVASAEFLRGQEVRQFTEAGLPVLKELAKQFSVLYDRSVSVNEVFDLISKRKVPFEMVKQVFVDLTSEGGKFFNMQEVLADTLSGKISNLKDAYQIMLYEMGQGASGTLNGVVDTLRKLIENYEDVGRVLKVLIATYGTYKALQIVEVITREAHALRVLKEAATAAEAAQLGLNAAQKLSIWGAIAGLVIGVGTAIYQVTQKVNELTEAEKIFADSEKQMNNEISKEEYNLKKLFDVLNKNTQGTEKYEAAKHKLLTNYSNYLTDVEREKIAVGDLAGVYDALTKSMRESIKARVSSAGQEKIITTYNEKQQEILDNVEEYGKKRNLLSGQISELKDYVTGLKEENQLSKEVKWLLQKQDEGTSKVFFNNPERWQYDYMVLNREREEKLQEYIKRFGNDKILTLEDYFHEEDNNDPKDTTSPLIKQIEKQIELLRTISKYREELTSMGVTKPNDTLKDFFPELSSLIDEDAEAKIKSLIASLQQLGEAGKESASGIIQSIATDKFNDFLKIFKENDEFIKGTQKAAEALEEARQKYLELMDSFGENAMLGGEGVYYDLSEKFKSYADGMSKIAEETEKVKEALGKTSYSNEEKAQQTEIINIERLAKEKNEFTKFVNEVSELGDKFFKDWLKQKGVPNSDLSKVGIFKVFQITKQIKSAFGNTNSSAFDGIKDFVNGLNLTDEQKVETIERLIKTIQDASGATNENSGFIGSLKAVTETKQYRQFKIVAEAIRDIAGGVEDLAEASGNDVLYDIASGFQSLYSITADVMQGIISGDVIGGISKGVESLANTILAEFTYMAELENKIRETKVNGQLSTWDTLLSKDSIFGTNSIEKVRNAKIVLQELSAMTDSYTGIENKMIKTIKRSGFAKLLGMGDQYSGLKSLVESLGYDFYNERGLINTEGLQAILDTYDKLGSADREWIENAIKYTEEYEEALQSVDDVLSDVYGSAVSSTADLMIENWISLGDAAGNYSEILSDVAKNYASLLIQQTLLDNIFNDDLKNSLEKAFLNGDSISAVRLFADAFEEIENYIPLINEIMQGINNEIPLLESSSNTLSSGITSITEETASLLASYINAIRADVSLTRVGIQDIGVNVKAILGLLPSSPTLSVYLAQIQANTYDTKLATEEIVTETHDILSELRGVIGTESGASAVRVSM